MEMTINWTYETNWTNQEPRQTGSRTATGRGEKERLKSTNQQTRRRCKQSRRLGQKEVNQNTRTRQTFKIKQRVKSAGHEYSDGTFKNSSYTVKKMLYSSSMTAVKD